MRSGYAICNSGYLVFFMSNIIVYTLLHKVPNIYDYRDCQGTLLYISMFLLLI